MTGGTTGTVTEGTEFVTFRSVASSFVVIRKVVDGYVVLSLFNAFQL